MTIASDPYPHRSIKQVAVFCGSRTGAHGAYAAAIDELGAGLAERDIGVISTPAARLQASSRNS